MVIISEEQIKKAQSAWFTPQQIQDQIRKSQASGMSIDIQKTPAPSTPTPTATPNLAQLPQGYTAQGSVGWKQTYAGKEWTYTQNEYNVGWPNYSTDYSFAPNAPLATGWVGTTQIDTHGWVAPLPNAGGTPWVDQSPWIVAYDELSSDMKIYLDNNPLAKQQFDLQARAGKEAINKFLMDTEKAVVEWKKTSAYQKAQTENYLARKDITDKAWVRQAQDTLNKTTKNTYYSAVSPVSSGAMQSAGAGRITEMATQIDELVRMNALEWDAYSMQVAENARRIQDDLANKLGQTLFDKLNAIDNGVANGTIATPEQLDRVYKENYQAILKEVPQLTNFAVQQMSDLTTNFMNTQKELRDNKIAFDQWAAKYNKEMSMVKWFAVDGNGNPILDVSGQQIEVPKDAPLDPVFDDKTGMVTTFQLDEDGNIFGTQKKVSNFVSPATEATPKASDFIDVEVSDGMGGTIKKKYDVVNKKFLEVPWTPWTPEVLATTFDKSKYDVFATDNWCFVGVQTTDDVAKGRRQCGEFVNDILNGWPWWIPDLRQQKLDMLKWPWASTEPVVGSAFIMDFWPSNPNAHTGIVEEVREDGIQIADMNRQGDEKFSRRFVPFDSPEYKLIKWYVTKWGQTSGSNLSSLSKWVLEKKADYNKLTPTAKEKIQKELLEKWAITWKTGNIEFITANADIPKEIEAVFQIYDNVKRAQELSKEVSTGFIDSKISKAGELFWGTKDDQELKQIVGKNLSMFMKELSGAAVSEQEVQRIKDFMPNFDQWDKKMDVNIREQLDTLETTMKRLKRQYGFDSVEDMRKAIFGN